MADSYGNKLDPQVLAVITQLRAMGMPPLDGLTVEQARQIPPAPKVVEPVGAVSDMVVPVRDASINLRVYQPVSGQATSGLIFYHGGGWVLGTVDEYDHLCRILCNRSGRTLISVDYRLAPEHKFPAGVEDAYSATVWIGEHLEEVGIASGDIAVAGDSAGATFAAVVCQLIKERGGPAISRQVLIYPLTTFDENTPSKQAFADGLWLNGSEMMWFRDHYLASLEDGFDPRASPLLATDLRALPPALVITGQYDPLRDDGLAYADRLRDSGVPVEYTEYPGMVHGFIEMYEAVDRAQMAIDQVAAYLRMPRPVEEHDPLSGSA